MLDYLPVEILEKILLLENLDVHDLSRLQSTNKALLLVVRHSAVVWRKKFISRWPNCLKRSDFDLVVDWKEAYKLRCSWAAKVNDILIKTSDVVLHKCSAPNSLLKLVWQQCDVHNDILSMRFIFDELYRILREPSALDRKYCATQMLRLLKPEVWKHRWKSMIDDYGSKSIFILEQGLLMISDWIQVTEDLHSFDMETNFQQLYDEVHRHLHLSHPQIAAKIERTTTGSHSASFSVVWNASECKHIMESVSHVLIHHQNMTQSAEWSIGAHLIDQAMKGMKANDILCPILAYILAQRFSVDCEILFLKMSPYKLLLRYRHQGQRDIVSDDNYWTYLDLSRPHSSHHLRFLSGDQVLRLLLHPVMPATHMQILIHVAETFEKTNQNELFIRCNEVTLAELKLFLNPGNVNHIRRIIEYYSQSGINKKEVQALKKRLVTDFGFSWATLPQTNLLDVEVLNSNEDDAEDNDDDDDDNDYFYLLSSNNDFQIRKRSAEEYKTIKYSVGMIMKHVRFGYDCVIYGWTAKCEASEEWIQQMGVDRLHRGRSQPFYNVLVADGSSRYAAQENLEFHPSPSQISNECLGRYFESYHRSHYLPNRALRRFYPEDTLYTCSTAKDVYSELV